MKKIEEIIREVDARIEKISMICHKFGEDQRTVDNEARKVLTGSASKSAVVGATGYKHCANRDKNASKGDVQ